MLELGYQEITLMRLSTQSIKMNLFIQIKGGEKNPDAPKVAPVVNTESSTLNPYEAYLEEQRSKQENAELGLLNETTKANIQNAEISTQQGMIQQAQMKDQLVEQIKKR